MNSVETNDKIEKKILVITSSIDGTVDYIIERYKGKAKFYRFDVDLFPEYEVIVGGPNQWTINGSKWQIKKEEIYSVYYRKPRLPVLDEFECHYRSMIAKDIIALINGIVDDFDGKVLTKPCILRKTENKIFQLLYAQKEGFSIPQSFIGNSNNIAKSFIEELSIIKPLTTGKIYNGADTELYQTNYFREFEEDISCTPIYLQKYVSKKYEVRLTYINGYFFPVRIDSKDKLDWRKDYNGLSYSIIECPKDIKDKCSKLLRCFELNYSAFDFIVNENNDWIYLEVNPNGQWQWLEQILNLSISERIIEYLIS